MRILQITAMLTILWGCASCTQNSDKGPNADQIPPAAVAVTAIEVRDIEFRRSLAGTLESPARFEVAPKIDGQIRELTVDLADSVTNGQVVAKLDDQEYRQAVVQAEAETEVARANLSAARSQLLIAQREMERLNTLQAGGVTTDAQIDEAKARLLSRQAGEEVALAQVTRAQATLEGARIRLSYTEIRADWNGTAERFVAARHINEGSTISANTTLMTIVELNPMMAVVFIAETDYSLLKVGLPAFITTDAYPGGHFQGRIVRVAPMFDQLSRQARVEIEIDNPNQELKPGMFVIADLVLQRVEKAVTVPLAALTQRQDEQGVFLLDESGTSVQWLPVQTGVRQGDTIQLINGPASGNVVVLGQQLIDDGSKVYVPSEHSSQPHPGQP